MKKKAFSGLTEKDFKKWKPVRFNKTLQVLRIKFQKQLLFCQRNLVFPM